MVDTEEALEIAKRARADGCKGRILWWLSRNLPKVVEEDDFASFHPSVFDDLDYISEDI